jgi:hypothetical protein
MTLGLSGGIYPVTLGYAQMSQGDFRYIYHVLQLLKQWISVSYERKADIGAELQMYESVWIHSGIHISYFFTFYQAILTRH